MVTGWSRADLLAKDLPDSSYAALGNCYSIPGVRYLLGNLYENDFVTELIYYKRNEGKLEATAGVGLVLDSLFEATEYQGKLRYQDTVVDFNYQAYEEIKATLSYRIVTTKAELLNL